VDLRRETDIEHLRRVALAQQIQIEQLLSVLKSKCEELEVLKGNPEELQQTLALIETLTKQKTAVSDAATVVSGKKGKTERKKREQFGPTEQPNLPEIETVFELDTADRACPSCGGELRPMQGQFDESEMLDSVEINYRVVKVKQQKYVCRCGGCVETAPGPERATRGGRYSLAFAIKVALDKYLDHLPLARQERILRRHGVQVTTQTLWDQLAALAERLAPTEEALFAHAIAQPVIGLDQTSWPKLEADAIKPWQMWCVTAPGVVCHRIRDDKGAVTFKELVGGYHGTIVCDALKTQEAGARDGPGILLAGCWAQLPALLAWCAHSFPCGPQPVPCNAKHRDCRGPGGPSCERGLPSTKSHGADRWRDPPSSSRSTRSPDQNDRESPESCEFSRPLVFHCYGKARADMVRLSWVLGRQRLRWEPGAHRRNVRDSPAVRDPPSRRTTRYRGCGRLARFR
jgi:transposase